METFKITFFDEDMSVYEVKTYHNVTDQSAMIDNIVARINSLQLLDRVKAEREGDDVLTLTKVVNALIDGRMRV